MRRTALIYVVPAAVIALAWLRLEEPWADGVTAVALALLALVPALPASHGLRLLLSGPTLLVGIWLALGRPLGEGGFFAVSWSRFSDGVVAFYDVPVPFEPGAAPRMHGVVLLALFGFCVALAFAAASRRPLPIALVLLAGAAWPATLVPNGSLVFGALILGAVLWILAAVRVQHPAPALASGAVLVVLAASLASSSAVAKDGVLGWQRWDPYGSPDAPVSVSYVWNSNYGGIDFPEKKTTVLRISGTDRSLYWRATSLDRFTDDRWIEDLDVREVGGASGALPEDPLLPPRARRAGALVTQDVQVVGLSDDYVIAASTPVGLEAPSFGTVRKLTSGVVKLLPDRKLQRGERYTVSSYAPRPEPAQLARLEPEYPDELDAYLELDGTLVPRFGDSGREEALREIFAGDRRQQLRPYRNVAARAEQLARDARTPYGAVIAIETWLRRTGGFSYDERPSTPAGIPALAHFVAEGKRGYCQQFAGAMALMLRFLGIPARVAAGFTSGEYSDGVWTVTDRNAHTWVEVWFPQFGWLSFDPTPGRGTLAANYSASSSDFNAGDAASAFNRPGGRGPDPTTGGLQQLIELQEGRAQSAPVTVEEGIGAVWILLAGLGATGTAIGLGKLLWRRARYWGRDPRQLAAAARRELTDFLLDQRIAVEANATPDELHRLIRAELGLDARAFSAAVAAARFGPPGRSAIAAATARSELRTLLRATRRSLGRAQRMRGFVALRSLRAL